MSEYVTIQICKKLNLDIDTVCMILQKKKTKKTIIEEFLREGLKEYQSDIRIIRGLKH